MGAHASEHKKAGYPLPVPWAGVTETLSSHKEKTHKSLLKPFWQGAWRLEDGGHKAILNCGGIDGVVLSMFGIEDTAAIDRARGEWACGWIDEAAPTLEGGGVDELVFDVMATSLRVPTHAKVKLVTENFPDEDHWTWKRFKPVVGAWGVGYHPADRQRMTIMIPKGDSPHLTDKDRAEWARALKDRPDLAARLLEGRPGVVQLGPQVAVDFSVAKHVAKEPVRIFKGEPLLFGQDGGLTPTTVIGQVVHGWLRVIAAFSIERGGMRQHLERNVVPWLTANAPWALRSTNLIKGVYDPAMPDDESDSDRNPVRVLQEILGGYWYPGPVSWEARKGAMITALNRKVDADHYALQIDPFQGRQLIAALSGRWHYPANRQGGVSKDAPAKPNHPHEDLGDAFCYWVACAVPELLRRSLPNFRTAGEVAAEYDPFAELRR